jgi:hypothetical protein
MVSGSEDGVMAARATHEEAASTGRQRISYVAPESVDQAMRAELKRCARFGTPRPESQSVRAYVPAVFLSFANSWQTVFREGVCDHTIKELCRVYVSRTVKCEYCGNQRSVQASAEGLREGRYDELLNFETSDIYDERQKAALTYSFGTPDDMSARPARPGRGGHRRRSRSPRLAGGVRLRGGERGR